MRSHYIAERIVIVSEGNFNRCGLHSSEVARFCHELRACLVYSRWFDLSGLNLDIKLVALKCGFKAEVA